MPCVELPLKEFIITKEHGKNMLSITFKINEMEQIVLFDCVLLIV